MYRDIKKIIPHREPMIMIDGYQKVDEDNAIAEKTFLRDDYGVHNGYVADSFLIECVAQTVAAHFGYKEMTKKDSSKEPGMLVTVDLFHFDHRVKADSLITITIKKTNQVGPFNIYQGDIQNENKTVAHGEIKLFVPEGLKS